MDYGLIGKIEKAKRYAQEPGRFHFEQFTISIDGENNSHRVRFDNGKWDCDCEFFITHQRCSHTMSIEELLKQLKIELPVTA
jgi:hypothetical protein